jgi:Type ISP C-terminal specificity domain
MTWTRLSARTGQDGLFNFDASPNLSAKATIYMAGLGLNETEPSYADLLWWHALAISYSPQYLADNPGGIAADWPRVPLPDTAEVLRVSADLGRKLAALLDPLMGAHDLPTVIAPIRRVDGTPIQLACGDLEVRAQRGSVQGTAVMPGHGEIMTRNYTSAEATALGEDVGHLGTPLDIYHNHETFWSCIPARVWNFKIGGFQVLKKWLSYREHGNDAFARTEHDSC